MEKMIKDMTKEELERYCYEHTCFNCIFSSVKDYASFDFTCFKDILFEKVEISTENA